MPNDDFFPAELYIQDLIEKFKKGDNKAFEDLWGKIRSYIYRLMKQGVDEDTADDLTSEVCAGLYSGKLLKYQPTEGFAFVAWLYRFATNLKINALKKKRPVNFTALSGETGPIEDIFPDNKTPFRILVEQEETLVRERALDILPILMAKLSHVERYVLETSICDERTDKEISRLISGDETGEDKYKMMRLRAIEKMQQMFIKNGIKDFPVKI